MTVYLKPEHETEIEAVKALKAVMEEYDICFNHIPDCCTKIYINDLYCVDFYQEFGHMDAEKVICSVDPEEIEKERKREEERRNFIRSQQERREKIMLKELQEKYPNFNPEDL